MRTATLADIVCHYEKNEYACALEDEERQFKVKRKLADIIAAAADSLDENGKMYPHQRRVGQQALCKGKKLLLQKEEAIAKCRCFDDLYDLLKDTISCVKRIGPLTIYDIAKRIAIHQGIYVDKVYLHCSASIGAKALGIKRPNGRISKEEIGNLLTGRISRDQIDALLGLSPSSIENFLCVYKDVIGAALKGKADLSKVKMSCKKKAPKPKSHRLEVNTVSDG